MLSFSLDNLLTKQLIALNKLILEKEAFLNSLSEEEKEQIHRYAYISVVGASTRIENALLTDTEVDWLDSILKKDGKRTALKTHRLEIENKLSKDKERSIEEVAGCRTVLLLIYEQAKNYFPLTEVTIRALHYELLRQFSKSGILKGAYKKHSNSVIEKNHLTGKTRDVFKTASPGIETEMAMKELISWYNKALLSEPWSLAVTAEFTYRFLAIHPFQDGNGRLGRALFLMSLLHSPHKSLSYVAYYFAIDRYIEKHKEEYYIVLNQCSQGHFKKNPQNYKIEYFFKYIIKVLEESTQGIDFYSKRVRAFKKLSEKAVKILQCFQEQPEKKLKPKDILEQTDFSTRTISYHLKALVEKEFIACYGQGAGTYYQLVF